MQDTLIIIFFLLALALIVWLFLPDKPRHQKKKAVPKVTKSIKYAYQGMNELDASVKMAWLLTIIYFLLRIFERFGV